MSKIDVGVKTNIEDFIEYCTKEIVFTISRNIGTHHAHKMSNSKSCSNIYEKEKLESANVRIKENA